MNIVKYTAPDFLPGKIFLLTKATIDLMFLLARNPTKESLRFASLVFKVKPRFTMVRNQNLRNLYGLIRKANSLRLIGDIVECGCWNGGSAAVMAVACMEDSKCSEGRTMWLFDSFLGLPPPGDKDGESENNIYFEGWNKGDMLLVKQIFRKIGFPPDRLEVVPGGLMRR